MSNIALADCVPQLHAQLEEFGATHPRQAKLPEQLSQSAVQLVVATICTP